MKILNRKKKKKIVIFFFFKKLEIKKNFKKNFNDKCLIMFFMYNLVMIDFSFV